MKRRAKPVGKESRQPFPSLVEKESQTPHWKGKSPNGIEKPNMTFMGNDPHEVRIRGRLHAVPLFSLPRPVNWETGTRERKEGIFFLPIPRADVHLASSSLPDCCLKRIGRASSPDSRLTVHMLMCLPYTRAWSFFFGRVWLLPCSLLTTNPRKVLSGLWAVRAGNSVNPRVQQRPVQSQISAAPSPVILHHTVWSTSFFIAYSDVG